MAGENICVWFGRGFGGWPAPPISKMLARKTFVKCDIIYKILKPNIKITSTL